MLTIEFQGWFQCRLATDPDPYDEPRGVSGYVRSYAGEPDLDRIVHWQPPDFSRNLGPQVGVVVSRVAVDGQPSEQSPLTGAKVMLHGLPKFEGRNGVIGDDGFEPIYPFDLEISTGAIALRRAVVPVDDSYPFEGLFAAGVDATPAAAADIQRATGISNLSLVWQDRLTKLQAVATATEPQATALRERISFLEGNLSSPRSTARFFGARMNFSLPLTSSNPTVTGLAEQLGFEPEVQDPWLTRFWLGGWDADALCGFCSGRLSIPRRAESIVPAESPLPRGVHRDLI